MQEHFSVAWVRAMAAATGCNVTPKPAFDHESVDGGFQFHGPNSSLGDVDSPRFEYQLKCKRGDPISSSAPSFPFRLSRKN